MMRKETRISRNIRFLINLYKEKGAIRSLLESGNVRFIRYATPGHFYSPIPDLHEIESKEKSIFGKSGRDLLPIKVNKELQIRLVKNFPNCTTIYHFQTRKLLNCVTFLIIHTLAMVTGPFCTLF